MGRSHPGCGKQGAPLASTACQLGSTSVPGHHQEGAVVPTCRPQVHALDPQDSLGPKPTQKWEGPGGCGRASPRLGQRLSLPPRGPSQPQPCAAANAWSQLCGSRAGGPGPPSLLWPQKRLPSGGRQEAGLALQRAAGVVSTLGDEQTCPQPGVGGSRPGPPSLGAQVPRVSAGEGGPSVQERPGGGGPH